MVDEARPTPDQVEKAFNANDAGAGIAWREGPAGKRVVKWEKGLDLGAIQDKIARVPLPFVAHFRIPTVGGRNLELCHPFTIDEHASIALKGTTKGWVLFHNGHWGDWKKEALGLAKDLAKNGIKMPQGRWSDSRAMAWFTWACGGPPGVLDMIDEKVIAFGPEDYEVVAGTGWVHKEGFWASNSGWETGFNYRSTNSGNYQGNLCLDRTCYNKREHGTQYCVEHNMSKAGKLCRENPCSNRALQGTDLCALHTAHKQCAHLGCIVVPVNGNTYCTRHRESGGAPAENPFLQYMKAKELFDKGELSKRKLKKARKEMEKAAWKESAQPTVGPKLELVKH